MSRLRYGIIGTGSDANSYIFQKDNDAFVVDNGFSLREFKKRMQELDFDPRQIRYIFVTHSHADHIKGVALLSREYGIPVAVSSGLLKSPQLEKAHKLVTLEENRLYEWDDCSIRTFPTSHDAPFSMSYSLGFGEKTFTIITDTGTVSPAMFELACRTDVLFLEANYCAEMLRDGPYPVYLKKRIASRYGHLSNADAVDFINMVCLKSDRIEKLHFCHLSGTNNSPQVLRTFAEGRHECRGSVFYTGKGEKYSSVF
jgi:phosphoribosyl 1,2-cyclic phosphodiesterase